MRYRQLGNSELRVSEISLGSWLTYGGGVEQQNAQACIHKAFDVGINFIDTANVYAQGGAESFLGEVLQGIERSDYVLATKVFFPMSATDRGLSAAQIRKQIDASLKRLNTDYVDLYQCHRYDSNTPLEETMAALTEVVRQGKARYIGFSEWQPEQIQAALEMADVERFVSSQPQYSMLWRKPEAQVFPLCAAHGIGQIVWSPLAQGVLTGKYQPGQAPPQDSRAANEKMNSFLLDELFNERTLTAVQQLKPIAQDLGLSMAQLALAWVLQDERVSSAIIGASRPEQVVDNAAASGVKLDANVLTAIDQILESVVQR
ncbi:aldo/keto reductase family protein [Nostoc sp. FACHB-152]|uniref:aldo/keto reductase family protein n=1 Tax=unclassified Nostoc TaxID=2593658 RepID=UPI001689D6FF|nr:MULTISPECIES: aldo/keto reductase family protein [unclassified Nostoc]MBD2451115.1 aldo/keto reductase family protein [Nostoc sp. FACHB-152]MBD2473387.1 aldo/keto reductase family protein [Nostoc sp. FACHB-145]